MQCVGSHMRNNFFVEIVTAQKYMLQLTEGALTQDMFNFAYVINISQGCNNLIRITWGCTNVFCITWERVNMDFSKWWSEILHEIECLIFHNYFVFFGGKKIFRNSRFPIRSVLIINISLFTSVACYCQNGLRRKHGKCSLCNEWWHSFMNHVIWKMSYHNLLIIYFNASFFMFVITDRFQKPCSLIWDMIILWCNNVILDLRFHYMYLET
jgi:hypothetical protein